jgi:transcription antitermination factor NusB
MHLSADELLAGLDHIRASPADEGVVAMIVRRPAVEEREVLGQARLDPVEGLVGDSWSMRGSPHPEAQLTVMNARAIALLAGDRDRWSLAGDQLYVDFDLSETNLPPGSRLVIGEAVIEVSALPHRGCQKFSARFGVEALRFVNSDDGQKLHLRGLNAKVVTPGRIQKGDPVRKQEPRDLAVEVLYEIDQRKLAEAPTGLPHKAYRLVKGVLSHLEELDAAIDGVSEHWRIDRMPVIDKTILRLGLYELRYEPDTPMAVVVSEAVRLAKLYSTEKSGSFVNGILATLAEQGSSHTRVR